MQGAMELWEAIDPTWPAAEARTLGGWTLRVTPGGGGRVNAATLDDPADIDRLPEVEAAMRAAGARPMVMVRDHEDALDAALAARRYEILNRTEMLLGPVAAIAGFDRKGLSAIRCDGRLARMDEIWGETGIGAARRAVMDRVAGPRLFLLGRSGDRPAGVAFAATSGRIVMLHALAVLPGFRQRGVARALTGAAAAWAAERGATAMALQVAEVNRPARRLYAAMGLDVVGRYRYRRATE